MFVISLAEPIDPSPAMASMTPISEEGRLFIKVSAACCLHCRDPLASRDLLSWAARLSLRFIGKLVRAFQFGELCQRLMSHDIEFVEIIRDGVAPLFLTEREEYYLEAFCEFLGWCVSWHKFKDRASTGCRPSPERLRRFDGVLTGHRAASFTILESPCKISLLDCRTWKIQSLIKISRDGF